MNDFQIITPIESDIVERLKAATPPDVLAAIGPDSEWLNHPGNYPYYYTYGRLFKPRRILEFGVYTGYSLLAMARGAADAGSPVERIVGVDNESYMAGTNGAAATVLSTFTNASVALFGCDVKDFPRDFGADEQFDLVSLDCHDSAELGIGWRYLAPGGIAVVDDLGSSASNCVATKYSWVFRDVHRMFKDGEVSWACWIDSFRGHLLVKKSMRGGAV